VKRIKTIMVAGGVAVAATSLSVGAWAATGHSKPAARQKPAAVPAETNVGSSGVQTNDVKDTSVPTGLVKPGQVLHAGKWVRSPNKKYGLILQTDGNLVLYHGKKALWSTVTGGHAGATAIMQTDGNLVVYSSAKKALWSSNTGRHAGATLVVQNDGNLVIYSKAKKALWSRHITLGSLRPGYVLDQGQAVRSMNGDYTLQQQTDGNLVLYRGKTALWSTQTTGSGVYALMQTDGNFVVYQGTKALWNSGTGGNPGATLAVQDDGNVVVYGKAGKALWSSRK
jgi:exopolysaccharide biosynthesis protein